jgi:hypothetical protein
VARRTVCQTPRRRAERQDCPGAPPPCRERIPASQAAFLDDVGRVLRAWRRTPLLPLIVVRCALVQLLAGSGNPAVAGLAGLTSLLLVGLAGSPSGSGTSGCGPAGPSRPGEAWRATLRCFGRFFVLGARRASGSVLCWPPAARRPLRAARHRRRRALSRCPEGCRLWATLYGVLLGRPRLRAADLRDARDRVLEQAGARRVPDRAAPAAGELAADGRLRPGAGGARRARRGCSWGWTGRRATARHACSATVVLALGRGAVAAYYLRTVPGAGPDGAVRMTARPATTRRPLGW